MATNFTVKEKSMGELIYVVDGEEWKKACEKAFRKLASQLTVKGFRKGQAPKAIIDKQIPAYDRQIQAISDNANKWLAAAVEEAGVTPISQPELDIKSVDAGQAEIIYRFAVYPEVKLGEYKDMDYNLGDVNVTDDELNEEIERIRKTFAENVVKEGPAESGDTVNIDYTGYKDGVPFEGGQATNFDLKLGSGQFIPGFEDQLIGSTAGEEKDLNLTFPEDYHAEDLKGAAVVFKVKVNEVKSEVLPEIDDEFAKDFNAPGVEDVEGMYKLVRERLEESKKGAAEQKADAELLDAVSANAEVDIPDVLVQEEQQNMFNQFAQQIQSYGMSVSQFLEMGGQTADQFIKGYEEDARKAVKLRLVLEKIAETEKLEASAEEIQEQYQKIADQYQMEIDKVKSSIDEVYIVQDIKNDKAYKFVKDHVKGSLIEK